MPSTRDRRPWIILSVREARALADMVRQTTLAGTRSPDLARALEQVHGQAMFILGSPRGQAYSRDWEAPGAYARAAQRDGT